MNFTLFFLATLTAAASAFASAPNPSNTNIRINNARIPITKSRTTTHLRSVATEGNGTAHDALHYLSNAIRDASTDAVKRKSGMRGMSRRGSTMERVPHRSRDLPVQERSTSKNEGRRSSMGNTRRQSRRVAQRKRRQSRFLPVRE